MCLALTVVRVNGLGLRVQSLGTRVWGLQALGFEVWL